MRDAWVDSAYGSPTSFLVRVAEAYILSYVTSLTWFDAVAVISDNYDGVVK